MYLKNRVFLAQSKADTQRKLDVVLRQIAGNRLTEKQRHQSAAAVGRRQYRFQFTQAPGLPSEVKAAADDQTVIRPIFDDSKGLARGPTAVLVHGCVWGEEENTVYLYLPKEKEEPRDESRKEEADSQ